MKWESLDSAPKDGTLVDLFTTRGRVTDCKWDAESKCWVEWTLDGFDTMSWCRLSGKPTHWMPLPPPPEPQP